MSAFPLAKLGMLAVRQISKPLANSIKKRAKTSPVFRQMLLRPAQFYHKLETNVKLRLLGLGRASQVKPLSDEMAVELAADMLGEFVIFGVASGCLLFEYRRQARKEAGKEDVQNNRLIDLERTVGELALQIEEQNTRIEEMTRILKNDGKQESGKTILETILPFANKNKSESVPNLISGSS